MPVANISFLVRATTCTRLSGLALSLTHPDIRVEVRKSTEPCNSKPDFPGTDFPKAIAGRVDDLGQNRITNGLSKKIHGT